MLYTVTFTRKHKVSRFNDKNQLIAEIETDLPTTIHDLPFRTAMGYGDCDNFKYVAQFEQAKSKSKVAYKRPPERNAEPSRASRAAPKSTTPAANTLQKAAAAGDLSAAINQ